MTTWSYCKMTQATSLLTASVYYSIVRTEGVESTVVGWVTGEDIARRMVELLNRFGEVDVPLPEGLVEP